MGSQEAVEMTEGQIRAIGAQLIAFMKGHLKSRLQSASVRGVHPYNGQPTPPTAVVKGDRVLVTLFLGNRLLTIDVNPAPGATTQQLVGLLREAFPRFRSSNAATVVEDRSTPRTVDSLEGYFEAQPAIARYEPNHNRRLELNPDQPFRLETSADGQYLILAIRIGREVVHYCLHPSTGVRASELDPMLESELGTTVFKRVFPGSRAAVSEPEQSPATFEAASETPAPDSQGDQDLIRVHIEGLRRHLLALRALGCCQVNASLDTITLAFPTDEAGEGG